MWSDALNCFITHGITTDSMILVDGGAVAGYDVGLDMGIYMATNDVIINVDPSDESAVAVHNWVEGTTKIHKPDLGYWHIGNDYSWVGQGSVAIGGQGKIIHPWTTGEQRAVAYYGAQKEQA